ncbi:hypothetical protein NUM3379_08620 [Kineococcus sp. NUM-3379]
MISVDVAVASSHTAGWAGRHAAGLVPDRMPYGLDHLAGAGVEPHLLPCPAPGLPGRVAARLLGGVRVAVPGGAGRGAGRPLLTWDERLGIPALARGGRPVVTGTVWATDADAPAVTRALARRYLPRAHRVFVNSSAQLEVLQRWGAGRLPPVFVPLGVDPVFWRQAPPQARVPGAVVSVGNDRHRDFGVLEAAWPRIRAGCPAATLTLATRREVRAGEGSRVVDVDHVRLREEVYARADVAVVPVGHNIHASGLTATLEAMSSGLPVVVSDNPGMADYVEHGRTGFLVRPGDPQALAAQVLELLAEPAAARAVGAAAAEAVRSRFTSAHTAARLAELLREAAGR